MRRKVQLHPPHPLLEDFPTNLDEADALISKMASRSHSKEVLEWRNKRFKAMGFHEPMATFLAHTHIDLHQMEKLITKGCDRMIAVDILLGTDFQGDDPGWNWQGIEEEIENGQTGN